MANFKITDFITKFNGETDEDVEIWIDRLESAESIIGGKDELTKLMPLFLHGNAYSMWKELDSDKKLNLEEIKSCLRETFGMTKLQAWQSLKTLSLEPMSSVDAYAVKIERLYNTVSGGEKVPDSIITATFLDGLPEKVRDQLILVHGQKLNKKEVLSAAKSILSQQVSSYNVFMGHGQAIAENKRNNNLNNFSNKTNVK